MPRKLTNEMFDAFAKKSGKYNGLLEIVRRDKTLDLEFRNDSASIYYRGGQLFKIEEDKLFFDKEYANEYPECEFSLLSTPNLSDAIKYIPLYKQAIDYHIDNNSYQYEREFAQLVVRDNNYGNLAKSTDYFIADIEYKIQGSNSEVDMVAIKWPTTQRYSSKLAKVSLIEMKYGDKSIQSKYRKPGLKKHLDDISIFLDNDQNREELCNDMSEVFNQKCDLRICIKPSSKAITINDYDIDVVFLMGNHQPRNGNLYNELNEINPNEYNFNIKFAVSSMMGYCLYDNDDTMWSFERCKLFANKHRYK